MRLSNLDDADIERMVDEQKSKVSPIRNAADGSVNLGSTFERDVDQNMFTAAAREVVIKVEGEPEQGSDAEEPATESVQSN